MCCSGSSSKLQYGESFLKLICFLLVFLVDGVRLAGVEYTQDRVAVRHLQFFIRFKRVAMVISRLFYFHVKSVIFCFNDGIRRFRFRLAAECSRIEINRPAVMEEMLRVMMAETDEALAVSLEHFFCVAETRFDNLRERIFSNRRIRFAF